MDFSAHNEEVKRVWEAFSQGTPYRVPMMLGINPRFYLLDPKLNTEGVQFRDYSENPDIMMDIQMKNQDYIRHNIYADHEMGLPKDGWRVYVDLQNYFEAAWFGADVVFYENNCPASAEMLRDEDTKSRLFDQGIPDPFGNVYAGALEKYEYMKTKIGTTGFKGVPIGSVGLPTYGTDGPMTVACNLRGTTEFCTDILADPDYAEELLDYITDATIERIRAWNKRFLGVEKTPSFGFADDSIQLIGKDTYRDLVLPRHKRLIEALSTCEQPHSIHLCGDATRHFPMLKEELNIMSFDTGFPVEHGKLLRTLGPDVQVNGGPHVGLLLHGTPDAIRAETRRILEEVKPESKKFIIREGNNLSPCTPPENIKAMYDTVLEYGRF